MIYLNSCNITAVVLFLVASMSCSQKELALQDSSCQHELTITEKNIKQHYQFSEILKNPTFVQLDTIKAAQYGAITSITVLNNNIYIYDGEYSKSLYSFNLNGDFISKVDHLGRGPGEYITPVDYDINESNGDMSILSWSMRKILIYDKNGNFKKQLRFENPFTSFVILPDKIYSLDPFPKKPGGDMLRCYSPEAKEYLSGLIAKEDMIYDGALRMTRGKNFYKKNETLRFYIAEQNMVYSLKNDTVSPFLCCNYSSNLQEGSEKSPPLLHYYTENNKYAYFKAMINAFPYDVFYSFEDQSIKLTSIRVFDDLTKLPVTLLGIFGDKVIGVVESQNIPYIKELIGKGEVNEQLLIDYTQDFKSDILVFYDLK